MDCQERKEGSGVTAKLITVETAAKLLSISRSQIYKIMDSGVLPYVKIRRSRRIELAALEKLIVMSRVGS